LRKPWSGKRNGHRVAPVTTREGSSGETTSEMMRMADYGG
jgi:hypothetical protein